MNKKSFILFCIITLFQTIPAICQSNSRALTWRSNSAYNAYLLRDFHELYDERRLAFASALSSKESLKKYQEEVKKSYLKILGDLPEKTELNPTITGIIHEDKFTIEKIIYESVPNHHVTANLYVPKGKGQFPAVLFFCGHEIEGKATVSYQKTARLFAENGFVVLVIDPISQGERIQLVDGTGKSLTRGATTEHTLLNAGANLLGISVATYELWDNIRGVDYLATRPEVDMTRVGCLGNSGGGNQTAYFMAYDDRVKVAALCSFFTQRERYVELAGPQDGCQQIPFEAREHLEITDFSIMFAPKPLIILAGYFDFVDYRGTEQAYANLKNVYERLSQPEKVDLFTYPDGHGISKPKREAVVSWFRKWLYDDSTKIKEGDVGALSPQELFCTVSGQVNVNFDGEMTIPKIGLEHYDNLAEDKKHFLSNTTDKEVKNKIRQLLGIVKEPQSISFDITGTALTDQYDFTKVSIFRSGEMPVPCLVYRPLSNQSSGKTILVLNDDGKHIPASDDSLINANMKAGNVLMLADLRGFGETKDDPEANNSKYWNHEYRNATISLYNGKPVLGQRVMDIFSILDYIGSDSRLENTFVEIITNGLYQPAVLHAALLDERIDKVHFSDELTPYKDYIETPLQKDMYTNVIPGVLKYYDLPDIVRRIGNGRLEF